MREGRVMAWFEHDGSRIYYEEQGEGEPVLLLPGWGGSIEHFGELREALAEAHRVLAADLPGSGRSEPQPRTYVASYLQDDAETLIAFIEQLGRGPLTLIGFSDGGELVADRPTPARSGAGVCDLGRRREARLAARHARGLRRPHRPPIPPLQGFAGYMTQAYGEANAQVMVQSSSKAMEADCRGGRRHELVSRGEIRCPALQITGASATSLRRRLWSKS